jgi:hypothetical protein
MYDGEIYCRVISWTPLPSSNISARYLFNSSYEAASNFVCGCVQYCESGPYETDPLFSLIPYHSGAGPYRVRFKSSVEYYRTATAMVSVLVSYFRTIGSNFKEFQEIHF